MLRNRSFSRLLRKIIVCERGGGKGGGGGDDVEWVFYCFAILFL